MARELAGGDAGTDSAREAMQQVELEASQSNGEETRPTRKLSMSDETIPLSSAEGTRQQVAWESPAEMNNTGLGEQELAYSFETNSYHLAPRNPLQHAFGYTRSSLQPEVDSDVETGRERPSRTSHAAPHGRSRRATRSAYPSQPDLEEELEDGVCCERLCTPCTWHSSLLQQDLHDSDDQDEPFHRMTSRSVLIQMKRLWVQVILESSWFCLLLLGITTSLLAWCIDETVAVLSQGKAALADS
mmetsp:Transcript_19643/g.36338  ORF Transcript_19643/g.36338 Transcript_19643/m.36338 type:complete len:244 (+) Transcript_19643:195-926(+)